MTVVPSAITLNQSAATPDHHPLLILAAQPSSPMAMDISKQPVPDYTHEATAILNQAYEAYEDPDRGLYSARKLLDDFDEVVVEWPNSDEFDGEEMIALAERLSICIELLESAEGVESWKEQELLGQLITELWKGLFIIYDEVSANCLVRDTMCECDQYGDVDEQEIADRRNDADGWESTEDGEPTDDEMCDDGTEDYDMGDGETEDRGMSDDGTHWRTKGRLALLRRRRPSTGSMTEASETPSWAVVLPSRTTEERLLLATPLMRRSFTRHKPRIRAHRL